MANSEKQDTNEYTVNTVVGTVYITPDDEIRVAGYDYNYWRPLEHANSSQLNTLSGEIRKEMANR